MATEGQKPGRGKSMKWAMEYYAYGVAEFLISLFPLPWVFRMGECIGGVIWHIIPKRRETIIRNLRLIFAEEMSLEEIEGLAKDSFCRTTGNLLSAARTARLSPEKLGKVMRIKNPELMEDALSHNKGVVMQLAHMGNWELLSRLIHLLPKGTKIGGYYRPLNNPLIDERVLKRRESDGSRMFSKRDNPLHVTSFLREGGIVGILSDQRVGILGEITTYFGRVTRASPLPSLLARRSKSPVISLAVTTTAPGRWELEYIPVENPPTTENCMRSLEKVIRTSPIDVFWLQDRWKTAINLKIKPADWLGSEDKTGTKHHRMLVWLIGDACDWKLDESWTHPDVMMEIAIESGKRRPEWLAEGIKVHEVPADPDEATLKQAVTSIDRSHAIPLDIILTKEKSAALMSAARLHSIKVIWLNWKARRRPGAKPSSRPSLRDKAKLRDKRPTS